VDYVHHWKGRAEIPAKQILHWMGVPEGTFYKWRGRYGKANEHNGWIPRDHWLEDWEKQAILRFHFDHPLEGYRRLTYMMLDANVVAVSASSVDRVLDGYSRYIVHWEIRARMTEQDVETVIQRAREKHPGVKPRIISDNGPQFVAKEFKQYIRICGMTHVRTAPYYPQSNGKLERYHRTIKADCIRPGTPLSLEDARRLVGHFVEHYNDVRLHSALGYIAPKDKLFGREEEIFAERDRKLEEAREQRRRSRQQQRATVLPQSKLESAAAWVSIETQRRIFHDPRTQELQTRGKSSHP